MSIQLRELIAANCIVDGVHLTVRYPGSSRAEPSLNPKYFELSTDQQAHAYISYIIVSSMPSSKATPIKFIVSRRRGGEERAGGIDRNNEIMNVSCGMMRAGNGKQ